MVAPFEDAESSADEAKPNIFIERGTSEHPDKTGPTSLRTS